MRLGPLPRKKTAVHVFGDFLAYLYRCTRDFITDTHGNGAQLWNAVEHNIQFVLSHPNGWEGPQQSKMRRSAVYGGLIPDTNEGKARIRFVTEGEASLHACVLNGLAADVLLVFLLPSFPKLLVHLLCRTLQNMASLLLMQAEAHLILVRMLFGERPRLLWRKLPLQIVGTLDTTFETLSKFSQVFLLDLYLLAGGLEHF